MTIDPGSRIGTRPRVGSTPDESPRGAQCGVVGVVLLVVALLLPGAPVTSDEPVGRVAQAVARHHALFAVSTYLGGLGLVALIVFAAAIRGRGLPGADVAATSVVSAAILIVIGMALTTGLAVQPDLATRPGAVRVAVDTGNVLIELAKLPFAAMIIALLPRRGADRATAALRYGGVLAATVAVASALPPLLVSSGPMQFGGVVDLAGAVPAFVWIAACSLALARRT